ncbi:sensor histidine kinase [Tenacibaculum crassostreae]|uniref:sensor histidine kinase n=1 Tax=Tenacibaculum crassostreae TaxID=502683 RepID=UPI00389532A5
MWIVILLYYLSTSWQYEANKPFLLERILFKLILQIFTAYSFIKIIVPYLLKKSYKLLFVVASCVLLYTAYVLFITFRCFYLLPKYPEVYAYRPPLIFVQRITDYYTFLTNLPGYLFPIVILSIIDFYKKEKELATIIEQQRSNELSTLRNQLNPHFLFNTLNNLYSLTLMKSDKASEVIEKLSKILDYTLYSCNSNLVSLKSEVILLQNYIDLEKLRYGNRVQIQFNHSIEKNVLIAPLILLTFVENAFKHGVSQETIEAKIQINLFTDGDQILFKVINTKPTKTAIKSSKKEISIGLTNVKKQLNLLYKNKHQLKIDENCSSYSITLKIKINDL